MPRPGDFSGAEPGRRANKRLGQHFLHDANIINKIVSLIDPRPGDRILEIGPGRGALTGALMAARPGLCVALEKDLELACALKRQYPDLNLAALDALGFAWERLGSEPCWKVVGNLPYNVASPLMWEAAARAAGAERHVFMIQKEVAERIVAPPGSRAYGSLSVWLRSFVRPRLAFVVSPAVFWPRPKVDSAVVVFEPVTEKIFFHRKSLAELVHICFQYRRKQLGTILNMVENKDMSGIVAYLAGLGLDPKVRPEELSPEQFQRISCFIGPQRS